MREPLVSVPPRVTAFTVVCPACAAERAEQGWEGATFAGRLDLDLPGGVFLCRNGHQVRVERARQSRPAASEAA